MQGGMLPMDTISLAGKSCGKGSRKGGKEGSRWLQTHDTFLKRHVYPSAESSTVEDSSQCLGACSSQTEITFTSFGKTSDFWSQYIYLQVL